MEHRQTWHIVHLILTILTGFLWLLVWVWRASSNAKHNRKVDKSIQLEQNEILKRVVRLLEDQKEEKWDE